MALILFLSDDDLSIVPPMQTWLGQAPPAPCLMTAGTKSIPYLTSLRMIKFLSVPLERSYDPLENFSDSGVQRAGWQLCPASVPRSRLLFHIQVVLPHTSDI